MIVIDAAIWIARHDCRGDVAQINHSNTMLPRQRRGPPIEPVMHSVARTRVMRWLRILKAPRIAKPGTHVRRPPQYANVGGKRMRREGSKEQIRVLDIVIEPVLRKRKCIRY